MQEIKTFLRSLIIAEHKKITCKLESLNLTHLNPNFSDDPMLAMDDVIDCMGIVSER